MTFLGSLQSAAAVVLTFGTVIFLHEAGHFFVCRWLGVRVERFAFGFGPELLGVTGRSGTRFSICALPLGGFVKPAGEDLESATGKPDEYFAQSWNRRLAIVAAGPAMNYLLAFALFSGVILVKGQPQVAGSTIVNVLPGYPAYEAGLRVNDTITAIDGKPISSMDQVPLTIRGLLGRRVELTYERDGGSRTVFLTPVKDAASGRGIIGVGIMPKQVYKPVGAGRAFEYGAEQCWSLTAFTVKTIAAKVSHHQRPDLAGPVGIVQMVSRAARSGWDDLIFLIGLISVAIGFFNILPVPLLDGGHAAMYLWEGLSGKPLSKEAMARANGVGVALLLSLLVFATYNDVMRIKGERAARQESRLERPAR
ncbi:MAG: site-2 protease family protein [Elusimicrobia bacterium]|nr:site-2 protease family protein [Elusimicrobiota bacterium]MDE2425477.1 site-2 protease family protein [Elusimicrobiota bacterium]